MNSKLSETCRISCQNKFVKLVHLVGFITKKFVTMQGHMNVKKKYIFLCRLQKSKFSAVNIMQMYFCKGDISHHEKNTQYHIITIFYIFLPSSMNRYSMGKWGFTSGRASYFVYGITFTGGTRLRHCYMPEGRGFDSRWCHWNFSLWSWG